MFVNGLSLIFGGLFGLIIYIYYISGKRTEGTIVAVSEKGCFYYPVISFTYEGSDYTMSTINGYLENKFETGQKVNIIFKGPFSKGVTITDGIKKGLILLLSVVGLGLLMILPELIKFIPTSP